MNTFNLNDHVTHTRLGSLDSPVCITGRITAVEDDGIRGRLTPDDPLQAEGTIAVHVSNCHPVSDVPVNDDTCCGRHCAGCSARECECECLRPIEVPGHGHASVAEMIAAVVRAAVGMPPRPFVVQYDDGEWIIAQTDDGDPLACDYLDEDARRTYATRVVRDRLRIWASQSTHEHQQRMIVQTTYARQHDGTRWMVSMDPEIAASLRLGPHYSSYSARHNDEAAQLLWEHLGCPRYAGLMIVPSVGEALWYCFSDWAISASEPYWERVHAFAPTTRNDSLSDLPGADPIVAAIHIARTASARHMSRCRAARASLVQYVLDETFGSDSPLHDYVVSWVRHGGSDPLDDSCWWIGLPHYHKKDVAYTQDEAIRILGAIAAMEMHGIGGPGGLDGGSTTTMSWRANLGKGRRNASDGAAWDAAIETMVARTHSVSAVDVMLALPFVRPHDLEWAMALAMSRAYQHRDDVEQSRQWCDVARAVMARAEEPGSPLYGPAVVLGRRYGL